MTKKNHNQKRNQKYQYQRVEQRRNNRIDPRSLAEQKRMEKQVSRFSIGTFHIFKPKPDTEISNFTLALTKEVPKNELYPVLHEAFNGHWDGEPVKSVYIHLTKPLPLKELRKRLREGLKGLLEDNHNI